MTQAETVAFTKNHLIKQRNRGANVNKQLLIGTGAAVAAFGLVKIIKFFINSKANSNE